MPFVITHWINLVAMVLLIFTGFYIHYPFFWGFESMARGLHVFFGFVLFINCICRLIMAFIVKSSPTGVYPQAGYRLQDVASAEG